MATYRPSEAPLRLGLALDLSGFSHEAALVSTLRAMVERWEKQLARQETTK